MTGTATLTRDELWNQRADAVTDWVNINFKFPRRGSQFSDEENRLARWLEDNRRSIAGGHHNKVTSERVARINTILGLLSLRDYNWAENADRFEEFVKTNQREPKVYTTSNKERQLATWFSYQKKSLDRLQLTAEREARVKSFLVLVGQRRAAATASPHSVRYVSWLVTAKEFVKFVEENGGIPHAVKRADKRYTAKRQWLINLRMQENLAELKREFMDQNVPGWDAEIFGKDFIQLQHAKAVVEEFKQKGFVKAGTANSRRLTAYRNSSISPVVESYLNEEIPGWKHHVSANDLAWEKNFNEMVAWIRQNGRNPQKTGGDETETRLAVWRQWQRKVAAGVNRSKLDEAVPGWAGESRRKYRLDWKVAAQEFVDWVNDHDGVLPRMSNSDKQEVFMYFWLVNQRSTRANIAERTAFLDENVPNWRGDGRKTQKS